MSMVDESTGAVGFGANDMVAVVPIPDMVKIMLDQINIYYTQIAAYDEQLGTDGGLSALTKAAITELGDVRANEIVSIVQGLLTSTNPAELLAVTSLIRRALKSSESTIKTYVDANKVEAAALDEATTKTLLEQRKTAVDAANMMRNVVETTNPAWFKENGDVLMPAPTKRRVSAGKRESFKRLKGAFLWTIDGTAVDGNKMADLVKELGGVSSTEIKRQLEAQKGEEFDFGAPPATFSFTFTNGDVDDPEHVTYSITARRLDSDPEDSTDEDDSYEEDDTTPEVEEDPFA